MPLTRRTPKWATDNGSIFYLLSGAGAASFDIDSATGQITVGASAKLDHETNPELRW